MIGRSTRPGFHTVTPSLIVRDLDREITFLQQALGATEHYRAIGSAGGWHVELRIGDSMVNQHYTRAKAAGATILTEPEVGFPGRRYRAEDLEGHRWMFMQRG